MNHNTTIQLNLKSRNSAKYINTVVQTSDLLRYWSTVRRAAHYKSLTPATDLTNRLNRLLSLFSGFKWYTSGSRMFARIVFIKRIEDTTKFVERINWKHTASQNTPLKKNLTQKEAKLQSAKCAQVCKLCF